MFTSIEAAAIRQNVQGHNYNTARRLVAALAPTGRVSYEQADKHNGGTAQVLVDGEQVGQASVLMVGPAGEYSITKQIKGYL